MLEGPRGLSRPGVNATLAPWTPARWLSDYPRSTAPKARGVSRRGAGSNKGTAIAAGTRCHLGSTEPDIAAETGAGEAAPAANCFALTASARILIPSCDAATDFANDSCASSGLWNEAPLAAVHHSQLACASPCFARAVLSASSLTPTNCACPNRVMSWESQ